MTLARIVTVFGLSGLRNAYRSVRSADGSSAMSGASRCDDAVPFPGPSVVAPTTAAAASRPTMTSAVIPLCICTPLSIASGTALVRGRARGGSNRTGRQPRTKHGHGGFRVRRVSVARVAGSLRHAQASRPSLRRGSGRARGPRRRGCGGRAVRPRRPRRVRARFAGASRRTPRRGRRAGGVSPGLAERSDVQGRAGEGEHVDPHARPPARSRPRSPRGTPAGGSPDRRLGRRGRPREARRARVASLRPRALAGRAQAASRRPARGARARLLRRVLTVRVGGAPRRAPRHHQEQDVRRARATPRASRRFDRGRIMEAGIHELTAGYALDALDPDERRAYEAHLAGCERCQQELASFWESTEALAVAASGPAPSPALRERILADV